MKYDFTSLFDRQGWDAIAVEGLGLQPGFTPDAPRNDFDIIPLWIADQNFATVPTITEALQKRSAHPAFGYYNTREEYYQAIINWQKVRNGVTDLKKEHIGYENGVLGGVITALNVLCSRGDKVLIHSPTYIGFTMVLENNGYQMVHSPFVLDEAGVWRMDYKDMEEKIVREHIHACVFCSPHNPCGRVWEKEELLQMCELFEKYDVKVVCDEIWSDLLLNGAKHTPLQSVNAWARENVIALYAPSKTFNLSGLIGSYHIIYNKTLRERVDKEGSLSGYNNQNVLSMHALIGAYTPEGMEWTDQLKEVLSTNINLACDYIREHFPGVKAVKPQGTYMLYVDCTEWCEKNGKSIQDVEKACWRVGCAVQDGTMFGGKCHFRMNLALPTERVQEALRRMDEYVFNGTVPLHRLQVGQPFPDLPCTFHTGESGTVHSLLKGKTVFWVLRYIGCTVCRYDVHLLKERYEEFRKLGAEVCVILQSDPQHVQKELQESGESLPFPILCDPEQTFYKALDIQPAGNMAELVGDLPALKEKGAKAAACGFRHGDYEGNERQLPALFITDEEGKAAYCCYGESITGLPSIDRVLEILKEL